MSTELLVLGSPGSALRVEASPINLARPLSANEEPAFDVLYEVDAHPFAGTLRDALLLSDLKTWRDQLSALAPPAALTLGGGRAAELRLAVDPQEGGREGLWAVEVSLARSGDDPLPRLRFLIFDVEPFAHKTVSALNLLLG